MRSPHHGVGGDTADNGDAPRSSSPQLSLHLSILAARGAVRRHRNAYCGARGGSESGRGARNRCDRCAPGGAVGCAVWCGVGRCGGWCAARACGHQAIIVGQRERARVEHRCARWAQRRDAAYYCKGLGWGPGPGTDSDTPLARGQVATRGLARQGTLTHESLRAAVRGPRAAQAQLEARGLNVHVFWAPLQTSALCGNKQFDKQTWRVAAHRRESHSAVAVEPKAPPPPTHARPCRRTAAKTTSARKKKPRASKRPLRTHVSYGN